MEDNSIDEFTFLFVSDHLQKKISILPLTPPCRKMFKIAPGIYKKTPLWMIEKMMCNWATVSLML